MITDYKIPPRCPVVPMKGIKWSHRLIRQGMQLDPLAAQLVPLMAEKSTVVLGVLDGLMFQQWWQNMRAFSDTTTGSSIRTDFPDIWRNATAAIIHIEDECFVRRNWMTLIPSQRTEHNGGTRLLPNEIQLIVSVEIIGETNQKAFSLRGEIAIRADHYSLKYDNFLEPEDEDFFMGRPMDMANFIEADRFSYAKMMLLLVDDEKPGVLKLAQGSNGSAYRVFQFHVVEHVLEVSKLWQDTQIRLWVDNG